MIPTEDYTAQKLEYTRNGTGRWKICAYSPGPSLIMVNMETGERMDFGVNSLIAGEFDPHPYPDARFSMTEHEIKFCHVPYLKPRKLQKLQPEEKTADHEILDRGYIIMCPHCSGRLTVKAIDV